MNTRQPVQLRLRPSESSATAADNTALGERLLAQAERLGLPRHRDPGLAALLAQLRPDLPLPPELYTAAAAVLALIYARAEEDASRDA